MSLATAVEVGVSVALGLAILWPARRELSDLARALPLRYRVALLGALLLVGGGQLLNDRFATFPLSDWSMHTESLTVDPRFIEYTAVLDDGTEERMFVGSLLPVVGKRLRTRMDQSIFGEASREPMHGMTPAAAADDIDALLTTVARAHAARRGQPVRTVRLWDVTVPTDAYDGPSSIRRVLVREFRVP